MQRRELISIELTADEGYILTDGTHYTKAVLLGFNEDEHNWQEIPEINTQEGYNEIPESEDDEQSING